MVGELKLYGFQPAKLEKLYGFQPAKLETGEVIWVSTSKTEVIWVLTVLTKKNGDIRWYNGKMKGGWIYNKELYYLPGLYGDSDW